jgi:hypothetical protein
MAVTSTQSDRGGHTDAEVIFMLVARDLAGDAQSLAGGCRDGPVFGRSSHAAGRIAVESDTERLARRGVRTACGRFHTEPALT